MSVPIVNVQPRPNIGAAFGQGLSGGLQQLIQGHREQKKNQQALSGLAPLFEELGLPQEGVERLIQSGLDPAQAVQALGHLQKAKGKEGEGLSNEEYSGILDQLEGQIDSGHAGQGRYARSFLPDFLGGGKARQDTAQFQSLSTSLLGLASKIALKQGIRNQREFDAFLKRTIPNESDDADTARGKITALRSYLHHGERGKGTQKASGEGSTPTRARNPKTGEVIEWTGSAWRKV